MDTSSPAWHQLDGERFLDESVAEAVAVGYRFSGAAGVRLGAKVAKFDLAHAFQPKTTTTTRDDGAGRR